MPNLKSFSSFDPVLGRFQYMSLGPEVTRHNTLHLEKTLRMVGELEALHSAFALSGWLMGILGQVVQVSMLPVSNGRHYDSFRCAIASKLIRDHYARPSSTVRKSLRKKRIAAYRSRLGCTRMSITAPC